MVKKVPHTSPSTFNHFAGHQNEPIPYITPAKKKKKKKKTQLQININKTHNDKQSDAAPEDDQRNGRKRLG